jgi:hypothetical protein
VLEPDKTAPNQGSYVLRNKLAGNVVRAGPLEEYERYFDEQVNGPPSSVRGPAHARTPRVTLFNLWPETANYPHNTPSIPEAILENEEAEEMAFDFSDEPENRNVDQTVPEPPPADTNQASNVTPETASSETNTNPPPPSPLPDNNDSSSPEAPINSETPETADAGKLTFSFLRASD